MSNKTSKQTTKFEWCLINTDNDQAIMYFDSYQLAQRACLELILSGIENVEIVAREYSYIFRKNSTKKKTIKKRIK